MRLPLTYNIRNVLVRWRSTLATVLGVALVVAVFVLLQAMAAGIEKAQSNTGDPRNILIVRKGSTAESSSQITPAQYKIIPYLSGISQTTQGRPVISADVVVLVSLPRRSGKGEANVLLRGVSPMGLELRPQVKVVEGRRFQPGQREVIVSRRMSNRFAHLEVGGKFKTSGKELTVVGITDGGNSAYDSEIWMDGDEARAIFDRDNYSSVLARVESPAAATQLTALIEGDKRLPLRVLPEQEYYAAQTATAKPIRFLAKFLAFAMSIGAIFAAMNTMYASVGSRTREIGTLRVLGFRRRSILAGFLIEGAFLAMLGGAVGCLLSLPMQGYSVGTLSFESFSETVFQFQITPLIAIKGLIFSAAVGVAGSFLPALRASRLPVIVALKSI